MAIRSKEEYAEKFEKAKGIFDYMWLLEENPCKEICISKRGIYAILESGIKLYLDRIDASAVSNQVLLNGGYEKEETNMVIKLASHLDKDAVVFDVGANLGWYGIIMKKELPQSNIYFFEPVPDTAARLKDNLELNNIRDAFVINAGLFKNNEDVEIYYNVIESGASSLADLRELSTARKIPCKMYRMDDFVNNNVKRLDFIKCDVEGTELFVYEGGKKTIEKYKPIIMSEMLRKWAKKFSYHPNDIIDFFDGLGYQCFVIGDHGNLKVFGRVTEDTVETNYYFLHKEKHQHIIKELCV